eukprot:2038842-Prymnesium_polylepis.1
MAAARVRVRVVDGTGTGVTGRPSSPSLHSFAESRKIVLLGSLKPLFNVCARLTKSRPAPLIFVTESRGGGR